MVKTASYPTPQDAEAAFYEALERADLDSMMQVWADDEEIVCVHPGGPRISGYEKVRESWAQIFGSGQRLKVQVTDPVYVQGMMVSVHSLQENIAVEGEDRGAHPVVATNIYLRTAGGWRLVAHHASPAPEAPRETPADAPKILH
jgi:ketosteroid isomerase-like protein